MIIWTFVILTNAVAGSNIEKLTTITIKENLGIGKLLFSSFKLTTTINLEEIEEDLRTIADKGKSIELGCEKLINISFACTNIETLFKKKFKLLYLESQQITGITKIRKRSINELGAIVKIITGNLDADDGKIIKRNIEKLTNNEIKLENLIRTNINNIIEKVTKITK